MCGIAGIIGLPANQSKPAIERMVKSQSHRGPDKQDTWISRNVALGHTRLSIIDLSENANQPMQDYSGRFTIVLNGEIYNFEEIKSNLSHYPFVSNSDTEVALAAFITWGKDCLQFFNGMFAMAIWDNLQNELFIARDRLGIKPFYYYHQDNLFVFGSEIRSLLQSGFVPKKLSQTNVLDYFMYQTVHAPNTIIKNIYQLLPGEYGILIKNKLNKVDYWNILDQGNSLGMEWDFNGAKKEIKRLLLESVERRMISDVPLGAFLSGGVDSSAIVALMAELRSDPINTFSVVFEEKEFDESDYSNLIAEKYNTSHTRIPLKADDFLHDLSDALLAMDVPSADGINTYTVSKVTKRAGITVALSGLGGDELFMGYPTHLHWYNLYQRKAFWKMPRILRRYVGKLMGFIAPDHRSDRIRELLDKPNFSFENIYPVLRKVVTERDLDKMRYQYPVVENHQNTQFAKNAESIVKKPVLTQASIGDISSYTQNILLKDSDQMGMASALEIRVPFFDHQLVEYVLKIPDRIKYPFYPKRLLVEALSPRIPDEIVHREKMGFTFPWELWLKNELKSFAQKRIKHLDQLGIFRVGELTSYWNKFLNGDNKITWTKIWLIVVLSNWIIENDIECS